MLAKNTVMSLIVGLAAFALVACSPKEPAATVSVADGFMPQLAPGQSVGAVFMRIANDTPDDIVLNYVHAPIASNIEVHRTFYEDGMMQMRPVKHVRVEAGESLLFEPGGYHLMLFGVENQPEVGETFELTLEFEKGVSVTTQVKVKRPG